MIVERGGVLRQLERAEVAEAPGPQPDVMPPVYDADEFATDLLKIPLRIVGEGMPGAGLGESEDLPATRRAAPGWS